MTAAGADAVRWVAVADATALRDMAHRRVAAGAARAIEQRARFLIVLAGGRAPRALHLKLRSAETDWSRWHVYFGDERCLPADDPDRNSRQAADDWLAHVPIPADQVHVMPAEQGADEAAEAYAGVLRGVGDFDLVLLGLGEDGHTASLFPNHEWHSTAGSPDVLAVFDAPKLPRQRVTMSAARLGRAREVLFLVEGESKRSAVAQWRAGDRIPAAAIRPASDVDVLVESALLASP